MYFFLSDMHASKENIRNYKEFEEFENFFQTLSEIKQHNTNQKKKCLNKFQSIKYFEPCLTIEKNSFFVKTQEFIKNISRHKIEYNDILNQTRNFMRYIGF